MVAGSSAPGVGDLSNDLEFLVERVKAYQRTGQAAKEQWWAFCRKRGSVDFDPRRHDAKFLLGFLAVAGASAAGTVSAAPAAAEDHRDKNMLVHRVKEIQRSSAENRKAWHTFCQSHGHLTAKGSTDFDPQRHEEDFLRRFVNSFDAGTLSQGNTGGAGAEWDSFGKGSVAETWAAWAAWMGKGPGADASWKGADVSWKGADASWKGADASWKGAGASWKGADACWKGAEACWKGADASWKGGMGEDFSGGKGWGTACGQGVDAWWDLDAAYGNWEPSWDGGGKGHGMDAYGSLTGCWGKGSGAWDSDGAGVWGKGGADWTGKGSAAWCSCPAWMWEMKGKGGKSGSPASWFASSGTGRAKSEFGILDEVPPEELLAKKRGAVSSPAAIASGPTGPGLMTEEQAMEFQRALKRARQ